MTDAYLLLTPVLLLGVLAIVRFVGCNQIYGLDETVPGFDGPTSVDVEPGDARVRLHWLYTTIPVDHFTVKSGKSDGTHDLDPIDVSPGPNGEHAADITGLDNGTEYYFIVASTASDGDTVITDSPKFYGTPGVTPFVTSTTLGGVRPPPPFTGWAGMAITIGSNDLIVTQLGRIVGPANVQSHVVKIVDAGPGNTDLASVTVNMPGGNVGDFAYAPLTSPITLQALRQYFVISHEVTPGDQWFNLSAVVTTEVANVTAAVYNDDAAPGYMFQGGANQAFVPVSFRY